MKIELYFDYRDMWDLKDMLDEWRKEKNSKGSKPINQSDSGSELEYYI